MSSVERDFLDGRVVATVGDLTLESTDAIVNAANKTLLGGGGVDGAIHDRGGPEILAECRRIRELHYPDGLPTGEAVITTGGKLAARYVIHTVGPIYGRNGGRDDELLAKCYENSCRVAVENKLASMAFPSISTGAFGYPKDLAAAISSETIARFVAGAPDLQLVKLVFYSREDAEIFVKYHRFGS